jgi:hypothetical protein
MDVPDPSEEEETSLSSEPVKMSEFPLWTIEGAEELLASLTGVLSARIVARVTGEIEEVHLLTSEMISPKQTVRNAESALFAHFGVALDHRKISVAQTSRPVQREAGTEGSLSLVVDRTPARGEDRVLFRSHRVENETPHRVRVTVSIEWHGEVYQGLAVGVDLPRTRLEATAHATLRAIEGAVSVENKDGESPPPVALALEGVKIVDAFERQFALVVVNAMTDRDIVTLAGAANMEESLDRSVVLATLQATDRWVRRTI